MSNNCENQNCRAAHKQGSLQTLVTNRVWRALSIVKLRAEQKLTRLKASFGGPGGGLGGPGGGFLCSSSST